jgi:hypothetical protein
MHRNAFDLWSTATMNMTQTLRTERTTDEVEHTVLEFCAGQSVDPDANQNETRTIGRHLWANPSPGNRVTTDTIGHAQGGYALLISFSVGHALPLLGRRSGRPRKCRGKDAERPRKNRASDARWPHFWPMPRTGSGQSVPLCRPWTRTVRVHGQSVSASGPRPQMNPHTVRTSGHATVSNFHKQSVVVDTASPRPSRIHALSTPTFLLWTETMPIHVRT